MKKRKIIDKIKKETKKNRIAIILDYFWCSLKYKANFKDYYKLEMYKMNKFSRSTLITKGKNNLYIKKYNNPNYFRYLTNLEDFYNYFNKSLKRKYTIVFNKEDLEKEKTKYNNYIIKEDTSNNIYIIEEEIDANDKLSKYLKTDNFELIIFSFLGTVVKVLLNIDNYITEVSIDTGEVNTTCINKNNETKEIPKVIIPKFKEALEFVEKISLDIPSISYIEWHLKIGNNGFYLESASGNPNYLIYQLPIFRKNNIGILPDLEVIERRKIN